MLTAEGITKSFMGIHALSGVSMQVHAGEILGVIGPNGAGKTTLFNVLTGLYAPDAGNIFFEGMDITNLRPYRRVGLGLARTFQNLEIFRDMSVLENVMVGGHVRLSCGFWQSLLVTPGKRAEERLLRSQALELLALLGLADRASAPAVSLSYGDQRRIEIARALASHPAMLFLDEPAAGMNPRETELLAGLIAQLRKDLQLTVVIIEHDMNLIMNVCDRIVVMSEGRVLTAGAPHEIRLDARVLEAYLGEEIL